MTHLSDTPYDRDILSGIPNDTAVRGDSPAWWQGKVGEDEEVGTVSLGVSSCLVSSVDEWCVHVSGGCDRSHPPSHSRAQTPHNVVVRLV